MNYKQNMNLKAKRKKKKVYFFDLSVFLPSWPNIRWVAVGSILHTNSATH